MKPYLKKYINKNKIDLEGFKIINKISNMESGDNIFYFRTNNKKVLKHGKCIFGTKTKTDPKMIICSFLTGTGTMKINTRNTIIYREIRKKELYDALLKLEERIVKLEKPTVRRRTSIRKKK